MKKILNIVSSAKGDASFSIKLADTIIEQLKAAYPDSEVHTHDLTKNLFPHLEETHLQAFNTPAETRTPAQQEAVKHSDEAIKEITDSDIIVIGVPLYNFSIPSTLKAWVDHIVRAGVTFSYATGVPEGLLKNKTVYLAIASGGIYSEGPMKAFDFTEPYLRFILGFIGLTDVTTFRVEGILAPDTKDTAVSKSEEAVKAFPF